MNPYQLIPPPSFRLANSFFAIDEDHASPSLNFKLLLSLSPYVESKPKIFQVWNIALHLSRHPPTGVTVKRLIANRLSHFAVPPFPFIVSFRGSNILFASPHRLSVIDWSLANGHQFPLPVNPIPRPNPVSALSFLPIS